MAAENEAGFEFDGRVYPVPTLDSLNMDEAQVLYDYSGLALEDFVIDESDPEQVEQFSHRLKNPGFIRALMYVAYQRGNPKFPAGKVKDMVRSANYLGALEALSSDGADDDVPPASTTSQDEQSLSEVTDKPQTSSQNSTNGSDAPAKIPVATGTGR